MPMLVTEGALRLRQVIERSGKTLLHFCKAKRLPYPQVHRYLSGNRGKRVTADFAAMIEEATAGEIPARLWSSRTLQPDPQGELPVRRVHGVNVHPRGARAVAAALGAGAR